MLKITEITPNAHAIISCLEIADEADIKDPGIWYIKNEYRFVSAEVVNSVTWVAEPLTYPELMNMRQKFKFTNRIVDVYDYSKEDFEVPDILSALAYTYLGSDKKEDQVGFIACTSHGIYHITGRVVE